MGRPAACATHRCPLRGAGAIVPRRDVLQQFSAQQYRWRCHPHRGYGWCRRLAHAGRHGRPDRPGIGLLGLVLVAAVGASAVARPLPGPIGATALWGGFGLGTAACAPALLRPDIVAFLLRPLRALHAEWVDARLQRLTAALERFRARPASLVLGFLGAIGVQGLLVGFYAAIAHSMNIHISVVQLAIIVPVSFIVQMLPVSINGLGVREATFGFYFTRLGLPLESALAVSFVSAALIMLFSTSGAAVQMTRRR